MLNRGRLHTNSHKDCYQCNTDTQRDCYQCNTDTQKLWLTVIQQCQQTMIIRWVGGGVGYSGSGTQYRQYHALDFFHYILSVQRFIRYYILQCFQGDYYSIISVCIKCYASAAGLALHNTGSQLINYLHMTAVQAKVLVHNTGSKLINYFDMTAVQAKVLVDWV